jgi:hypothetical protein
MDILIPFVNIRISSKSRGPYFWLFWPLTIAQSHTSATTTLVDEFDGGQLHGLPDA